jgi:signal transduction histidine kinase
MTLTPKKRKLLGEFNRFRLMLGAFAVLLPAAGLIYVNFSQLREFERDKVLEAAIHRDFGERLALFEKQLNKKAYTMLDEARQMWPSPDDSEEEKEKKLDLLLARCPCFAHLAIFDEKGFVVRSQPSQMDDRYFSAEHKNFGEGYYSYFKMDGKEILGELRKKTRPFQFYSGISAKRHEGEFYSTTAIFTLPGVAKDRLVIGAANFDPYYLKKKLFPEMIQELLSQDDQSGKRLAMAIYPVDSEGATGMKPLAVSSGWDDGKPEVSRKLDVPFNRLALGIRIQGTSVKELGEQWIHRSFWILAILSLMIIGGLVLSKRMVSKEMAVAKLKSDFVSNVSHELRTPLALIRLYAETLELGRITTPEKKEQYYRIIRKESERLTALINNILDFSRIEAGRKEYEFLETDIGELVRNTLDSYRYQVEQQGFEFEEQIEPNLPQVFVDREAIARALVNLVNNALKYSNHEKFLGVKLYRDESLVKLEVVDHGIGIAGRDQTKIFEKFYRAGDPLVHNTKGSGLGLSLVRHISEAHGGDIEVESTPGRGSKFTLSLPLTPPNLRHAPGTA